MNSSSQSFAPVSRLLWKEYRVQRAFWLAMLLFGMVPQFLIRMILPADQGAPEMVWSSAACGRCSLTVIWPSVNTWSSCSGLGSCACAAPAQRQIAIVAGRPARLRVRSMVFPGWKARPGLPVADISLYSTEYNASGCRDAQARRPGSTVPEAIRQ